MPAPLGLRLLWIICLAGTAGLSTYAYITPQWIEKDSLNIQCGLIKYCNNDVGCSWPYENYGDNYDDIPGLYWQIASIHMALGSIIAILMTITSVITFCKTGYTRVVHLFNILAGVLLVVGALLASYGFKDLEFNQNNQTALDVGSISNSTNATGLSNVTLPVETAAGDQCRMCIAADAFTPGDCTLGFSYILGCSGTGASFLASVVGFFVLSFSEHRKED